MKIKCVITGILTVFLFGLAAKGYSQEKISVRAKAINMLDSKKEEMILKGFWLIVDNNMRVKSEYRDDVEIKKMVWDAFKFLSPNVVNLTPEGSEGGSAAEYLLKIMGDTREIRAMPYLIANIHVSGCQYSLSRLGAPSIPYLQEALSSGSELQKIGAARTLALMLEEKPKEIEIYNLVGGKFLKQLSSNPNYGDYAAAGKDREKIRGILKSQLGLKDSRVKEHVLRAFYYVVDESDAAELERIVNTDSYKEGGGYPVREAAKKSLDKIKSIKGQSK